MTGRGRLRLFCSTLRGFYVFEARYNTQIPSHLDQGRAHLAQGRADLAEGRAHLRQSCSHIIRLRSGFLLGRLRESSLPLPAIRAWLLRGFLRGLGWRLLR